MDPFPIDRESLRFGIVGAIMIVRSFFMQSMPHIGRSMRVFFDIQPSPPLVFSVGTHFNDM
jgi:hypothetical protein